jgi:hypothetical protein
MHQAGLGTTGNLLLHSSQGSHLTSALDYRGTDLLNGG